MSLWNRRWFRMDCDWYVRILACTFAIKAHGFEPSQISLTTGLSTHTKLGEHMETASGLRFPSPLLLSQPPPVYEVILTGILQRLVWLARTCFIFEDGSNLQADTLNTSAVEKYGHKSLWLLFFFGRLSLPKMVEQFLKLRMIWHFVNLLLHIWESAVNLKCVYLHFFKYLQFKKSKIFQHTYEYEMCLCNPAGFNWEILSDFLHHSIF